MSEVARIGALLKRLGVDEQTEPGILLILEAIVDRIEMIERAVQIDDESIDDHEVRLKKLEDR
jgi:hypothetical protein